MTLFVIAVAWLLGATLGALGYESAWPAVVLGGAGAVAYAGLTGQRRQALLVMAAALLCVASLTRYEASLPPVAPAGVAVYNDAEPVRLLGVIDTEPEERITTQRFVVEVVAVEVDGTWQRTDGRVLVTQRPFPRYGYGDLVDTTARLETPPVFETFDYREYLARKGIVSTALYPGTTVLPGQGGNDLKRLLLDTRMPFGEALQRSLPEPEAALAQGILLGQRTSIPKDVNEAFKAAGISHLIAISGYNVMLVAGAVLGGLAPFIGRPRATWLAMAIVVVYAVFVGASPSVVRATLMALVMLGASLVGRPGNALTGVTLAGALMVLWDPLVVDDVSFQLSFAATLGIVVLATPMREWLLGALYSRLPNAAASALADSLAVTTAASLAVLPIIASTFGRLSLVSLPANVVAGPLFVFALGGSFVTAAVGAMDAGAGRLVGEITYLPLHYLVVLAERSSNLPMAWVSIGGFGFAGAVGVYVALAVVAKLLGRKKQDVVAPGSLPRVGTVPVLAVASILVTGVMWWGALQPDDDRLRVSVLDVGQGDAILVESPAGTRVLIDGGPSGALVTQALGDVLSPAERRIDLMVLTHAQDDHVTGLVEVLERYDVGAVLWNDVPGETGAYDAWVEEVTRQGLPVMVARAGQVIDLGGGASFEVLHPQPDLLTGTQDDLNNNAIVLRLVYGDTSFLLTGDIEVEAENAILDAGFEVAATVLKIAHHGSDGATTEPFLDAVSPSIAAVSAGEGNVFGHPSPSLRLRLAGVPLLRTDVNGTITFHTDGRQLWLDYERGDVDVLEPRFAP